MAISYKAQPAAGEVKLADVAWILGILVLATVLRAVNLDASLWYDEVLTLVSNVRGSTADLFTTYESLNNHLLFTLLAQWSTAVFGEAAWSLRLPAFVFGVASIWALWRLAHDIVSPWEARLAALMMAVSYHHVWFSQNARGYTGLLFFALLTTWLLVRLIRRPSWGGWVLYGLCLAAAMFVHLSAIFFILAQGLAFGLVMIWRLVKRAEGVSWRSAVIMPAVGCGVGALVTLALYGTLIPQMIATFSEVAAGSDSAVVTESIAEWKDPLWMVREIAASLGPVLSLAMPLILFVMIVGTISLARRSPLTAFILPLHLIVTIAILVALSFRVWPRYFLIDLGLICLILTHGAFAFAHWLSFYLPPRPYAHSTRLCIAFAGIGIAATLVLLPANYLHPKQDYSGAAAYVEANRSKDAKVITIGLGSMPFEEIFAPDWSHAETLEQFQALYQPGQETWAIYTFIDVNRKRHADIMAAMADDFSEATYLHGTLSDGGMVIMRTHGE